MELLEALSNIINEHGLLGLVILSIVYLIVRLTTHIIINSKIKFKAGRFYFKFPHSKK